MRARKILGLLSGLFLFGLAASAAAGETSRSDGAMADDLRAYYGSEKTEAFVFVGLGALSAAGGGLLLTQRGDFSKGLGAAVLGLGVLEAVGAVGYAFAVDAKSADYSRRLAEDPVAFRRDEAAHIHGTNSRFVFYRLAEAAVFLGGAGAAAYGFASGKDAWKGAGIGVAAQAAVLFTLDSIGNARAHAYENELRDTSPKVALQVGGADRPWGISLGGHF